MRVKLPHRDTGAILAHAFQFLGFGLLITGLALYSVPLALIASGGVLFVAGGLALRK